MHSELSKSNSIYINIHSNDFYIQYKPHSDFFITALIIKKYNIINQKFFYLHFNPHGKCYFIINFLKKITKWSHEVTVFAAWWSFLGMGIGHSFIRSWSYYTTCFALYWNMKNIFLTFASFTFCCFIPVHFSGTRTCCPEISHFWTDINFRPNRQVLLVCQKITLRSVNFESKFSFSHLNQKTNIF